MCSLSSTLSLFPVSGSRVIYSRLYPWNPPRVCRRQIWCDLHTSLTDSLVPLPRQLRLTAVTSSTVSVALWTWLKDSRPGRGDSVYVNPCVLWNVPYYHGEGTLPSDITRDTPDEDTVRDGVRSVTSYTETRNVHTKGTNIVGRAKRSYLIKEKQQLWVRSREENVLLKRHRLWTWNSLYVQTTSGKVVQKTFHTFLPVSHYLLPPLYTTLYIDQTNHVVKDIYIYKTHPNDLV